MRTPLWVQRYWVDVLWPALSAGDLDDAHIMRVFAQTLQDWAQHETHRGLLTDATIGRYLTETRNWIESLPPLELCPPGCRKFSAEEVARVLVDYNQPTEWWAALTARSHARVDERNENQLPLRDPAGILARLEELLQHEDWAPLAVGLAGVIGRRIGEVLYSGQIMPKTEYSVMFQGRLKRRGAADSPFEIPTLCKADLVLAAWQRLRDHAEIRAMGLPLQEDAHEKQALQVINQRLSPLVRKAADHYFQELIPTRQDDEAEDEFHRWGLYAHLFRSVFRTLAIWLYCPVRVDPDTFSARILGHTYYQRLESPKERLNFASEHFYRRYYISDLRGNVDGRRGIRLGEPGVTVLDVFQKDATLPAPATTEAGKPKKRRKRVRGHKSKTGYSSIRPLDATRDWFDQVAEENDLAWKDTDDTLQFLLRVYEEHKGCAGGERSQTLVERMTPQFLGITGDLETRIAQAMRALGSSSFQEFFLRALDREANVQIGLQKSREKRETADLSQAPLSTFWGSRRPEAALERTRRAVAAVIDFNRTCTDPNGFWFINVSLIREITKASPDYIRPVLEANAALLKRHHEHFKIEVSHNKTPAHKATPISRDPAFAISDNPADLKSLSDLKLPALSAAEEVVAAPETQPA